MLLRTPQIQVSSMVDRCQSAGLQELHELRKFSLISFVAASNDVVVTNCTSGYLEYWSVTITAHCPLGNGPQKSASSTVHGLTGRVVIFCLRSDLAFKASLREVFNL